MHRLSGEDAGFLAMDLPGQPMCSMALGVLEPSAEPLTLDELRAHLAWRLDDLPSWRWRIVPVPFGLHQPVAVDDPDFRLDDHVREVRLDGGDAELEAWFAALAEEHLDPDRPLWQVWLVSGLDGGEGAELGQTRQAVVVKYHHALADGVGAVTTLHRVFSDEPLPPVQGHGPYAPEPVPGAARLVLGALWAHLVGLLTLLGLLLRTWRGSRAVRAQRERASVTVPPYAEGAPRTVLNDAFTPGRAYVRAELPMAGIKAVKDAAGVTLNDVVLGVVAGATRRYLEQVDELPDRPLLTNVPMASGAPGPGDAPRQHGNRFWAFTTTLATDVTDPWERLLVISATARQGKTQLDALGTDVVLGWLDRLPPALARRGVVSVRERLEAATEDVDTSILVSNIRGPAAPWSLRGRVFTDIHCDGPPSNGVGINVMVWSYGDRMTLGILGYADALRHPEVFRDAVATSFDDLVELAAVRTRGVA